MTNVLTRGLPFEPEPLQTLSARYGAALQREWNGDAIVGGIDEDRPGLHREHIFDVEWQRRPDDVELWRVIISIERHTEFGRVLHVSASAVANGPTIMPFFFTRAMLLFMSLSAATDPPSLRHQFLHGPVAHLIFDAPGAWCSFCHGFLSSDSPTCGTCHSPTIGGQKS